MNHTNPKLLRFNGPHIQLRPIRIRRNQRQSVQQVQLPSILQFQTQIPTILHRKPKLPLSTILINHESPLNCGTRFCDVIMSNFRTFATRSCSMESMIACSSKRRSSMRSVNPNHILPSVWR
ncbi:hypothetical protein Ahy_A07g033502 isoform G [Arachis hypogaea]|uniref:Uncharacterized protein n=1 Tax=Arachis hypogaea TaxID=3818 RepID=A0A445C9C0_ARAHY|nr:hypothetical protein Ahy_A07g033502 isoform G [Arachis hypogaea]